MLGFNSISETPISTLVAEVVVVVAGTVNMFHNDLAFRYLGSLGWVGTYNDRLHAFLSDNLSREGALSELQAAYIKVNGKLI